MIDAGRFVTTGMPGTSFSVTQPVLSRAATSALPATSARVLRPCVMLPTLQLLWSSGAVANVRSVDFIQNTQPAGTRPVRPSSVGGAVGSSKAGTPGAGSSANVMAIGSALG